VQPVRLGRPHPDPRRYPHVRIDVMVVLKLTQQHVRLRQGRLRHRDVGVSGDVGGQRPEVRQV
jgi:hypothetical protein